MTEDEAKTKWCPFSRTTGQDPNQPSWNRVIGRGNFEPDTRGSQCIASACMAWRETKTSVPEYHPFSGDQRPGEGYYWSAEKKQWWKPVWSYEGFCGIAGAPQ